MAEYKRAMEILEKYEQEHLLTNYEKLSEMDKEKLVNQILSVDFEQVDDLFNSREIVAEIGGIEPISYIDKSELSEDDLEKYNTIGIDKIKSGKLAVVTMAGRTRYKIGA